MRPAQRSIALTRGDTYQHLVSFQDANGDPVDVSANTYTAQLRAYPDADTVLADFTVDATAAAAGTVWLSLDEADTAELEPGRRAWDVQQDAAGIVTTIMGGHADVVADVTRVVAA